MTFRVWGGLCLASGGLQTSVHLVCSSAHDHPFSTPSVFTFTFEFCPLLFQDQGYENTERDSNLEPSPLLLQGPASRRQALLSEGMRRRNLVCGEVAPLSQGFLTLSLIRVSGGRENAANGKLCLGYYQSGALFLRLASSVFSVLKHFLQSMNRVQILRLLHTLTLSYCHPLPVPCWVRARPSTGAFFLYF